MALVERRETNRFDSRRQSTIRVGLTSVDAPDFRVEARWGYSSPAELRDLLGQLLHDLDRA
ncbi:MAG: hypothetical protein M0Z91_00975 [Actinomycetota bacterium]|nr:hypothetical protein [Actinomycetota bacterium]